MSELKKLVEKFQRTDERSESWVAKQMGISRSGFNGWWTRGRTSAPSSEQLRRLAQIIKTPYRDVLDAALHDYGYLPADVQGKVLEGNFGGPDPTDLIGKIPADAPGTPSEGQIKRERQDEDATHSQNDGDEL